MNYDFMRTLIGPFEVDPVLKNRLPEVEALCKELDIEELYFFGSSVDGRFKSQFSDIDVIVVTKPENLRSIVRLNYGLKKIFKCPIDIFHKNWHENHNFNPGFLRNKVKVYEKTATNSA